MFFRPRGQSITPAALFAVGAMLGYAAFPIAPSAPNIACPSGGQPPCLPRDFFLADGRWEELPCAGVAWDKVKEWSTKGLTTSWNAPEGSHLQIHNHRHDMEILAAAMRWRRSQAGGCAENDCDPGPGVLDCKTKV